VDAFETIRHRAIGPRLPALRLTWSSCWDAALLASHGDMAAAKMDVIAGSVVVRAASGFAVRFFDHGSLMVSVAN